MGQRLEEIVGLKLLISKKQLPTFFFVFNLVATSNHRTV